MPKTIAWALFALLIWSSPETVAQQRMTIEQLAAQGFQIRAAFTELSQPIVLLQKEKEIYACWLSAPLNVATNIQRGVKTATLCLPL